MKVISVSNNSVAQYCRKSKIDPKNKKVGNEFFCTGFTPIDITFKANLITKSDLTARLFKIGLGGLDKRKFQAVMSQFATSQGYSCALLQRFEILAQRLDENKIKKGPLMQALLTELSPNIEKFEKALDKMLQENIAPDYIVSIFECAKDEKGFYNEIKYEKIKKLLHCRELGLQNKEKLCHRDIELTNADIDALFFELPQMTLGMYDILGEKAFTYSFKDKIDNVIDYLVCLGREFSARDVREKLVLKTNPVETYDYCALKAEIDNLKQKYKMCDDENSIQLLEKRIATLTRKKNDILEGAIKDPRMILETAMIVASLQAHPEDAMDVLTVSNPQTDEEFDDYYRMLNEKICLILGIENVSERVRNKLDFTKSKTLPRIYSASGEFKRQFVKLVSLIEDNPTESTAEFFNLLPQNVKIKTEFKKRGIDYDKYVEYNPNSCIELINKNGEKNGIKIRKVDMNDIPKVISLGQDADCCTKIGGRKDYASISYLKNKFISAIEVLDCDVAVGNTMCYFAEVDGELSFILDNIAFKPRYRYNQNLTKGIYDYARKLCEEVGKPDIPIYLSGQRNQVEDDNLVKEVKHINIIGDSGRDSVYLDFMGTSTELCIEKMRNLYAVLTKIN